MKSTRSKKSRDLALIVTSFLLIFGCGFAASHVLTARSTRIAAPIVTDTEWETSTLKILQQKLKITREQEKAVLEVLQTTQRDLNDTRERAVLEYHLHLLKAHDQLASHLNEEQQTLMLKSRGELETLIRKKFPHLLEENQLANP